MVISLIVILIVATSLFYSNIIFDTISNVIFKRCTNIDT